MSGKSLDHVSRIGLKCGGGLDRHTVCTDNVRWVGWKVSVEKEGKEEVRDCGAVSLTLHTRLAAHCASQHPPFIQPPREGGKLSPRALEAGDGGMGAAQRRQCSGMMRDAGCRAAPVEGGWRTSNANIITAAAVGGAADCEHDYFFAQMVCAGRVR